MSSKLSCTRALFSAAAMMTLFAGPVALAEDDLPSDKPDVDVDVDVEEADRTRPSDPTDDARTYMDDDDDDDDDIDEITGRRLITPFGFGFSVGGGVSNFTDDESQDVTGVGGNWTARLHLGTRLPIGFEAAYIGTAQALDAIGVDDDAMLISNGLEGDIRLNLTATPLQPYIFGGLAWKRYSVSNTDVNFSSVNDNDNVVEVPLGIGLAWRAPMGFLLDARFDYRPTFDEELVRSPTDPSSFIADLETWNLTARAGWEF